MKRKTFLQSLAAAFSLPLFAAKVKTFDCMEAIERMRKGEFISVVNYPDVTFFFYSRDTDQPSRSNTIAADPRAPKGQFLAVAENNSVSVSHFVHAGYMMLLNPKLNLAYQSAQVNEESRKTAMKFHALLDQPYKPRPERGFQFGRPKL